MFATRSVGSQRRNPPHDRRLWRCSQPQSLSGRSVEIVTIPNLWSIPVETGRMGHVSGGPSGRSLLGREYPTRGSRLNLVPAGADLQAAVRLAGHRPSPAMIVSADRMGNCCWATGCFWLTPCWARAVSVLDNFPGVAFVERTVFDYDRRLESPQLFRWCLGRVTQTVGRQSKNRGQSWCNA